MNIEGSVIADLVEDITGLTGETYHGRSLVMFRHVPGLFGIGVKGKGVGGREYLRKLVLHKGILNQCALQEPPTPYWAVLDAMIDLKDGFTQTSVIDRAVQWVGEEKRAGCQFAWEVLKNHHRHPRKKDAAMAYMVDLLEDGTMTLRARAPEETLQYFMAADGRRKEAKLVRDLDKALRVVEE